MTVCLSSLNFQAQNQICTCGSGELQFMLSSQKYDTQKIIMLLLPPIYFPNIHWALKYPLDGASGNQSRVGN